jgi:hypothetical protein
LDLLPPSLRGGPSAIRCTSQPAPK